MGLRDPQKKVEEHSDQKPDAAALSIPLRGCISISVSGSSPVKMISIEGVRLNSGYMQEEGKNF